MWRDRDTTNVLAGLGACLLLSLGSACAPDGPPDGIPTHPGDTFAVSLEWDAPTTDALGRPLDDLVGYRLYYRESTSRDFEPAIDVGGSTRATVRGLPAGEYLFAVAAVDAIGNESELSELLPVEIGR